MIVEYTIGSCLQIGNAVPPPMGKAIGLEILKCAAAKQNLDETKMEHQTSWFVPDDFWHVHSNEIVTCTVLSLFPVWPCYIVVTSENCFFLSAFYFSEKVYIILNNLIHVHFSWIVVV